MLEPEGAHDVKRTGIPAVILGIVTLAYEELGSIPLLMWPMRRIRQRAVVSWGTFHPPAVPSLSLFRRI